MTLQGDITLDVLGILDIMNGGTITVNPSKADNNVHYIKINAGNLTVDATSAIIGDGLGYAGGWATAAPAPKGFGPGGGKGGGTNSPGGGGGYGSKGENGAGVGGSGGSSYGGLSKTSPLYMGSGGGAGNGNTHCCRRGGTGGGAVYIDVADTFTMDGIVSMNGGQGSSQTSSKAGGGGSGGSIYVVTGTLSVNGGWFQSNGGLRGTGGTKAGAGAGGRIALYANTINGFIPDPVGLSTVARADGWGAGSCGGAGSGTVFLNYGGQPVWVGGVQTDPYPSPYNGNLVITCGSTWRFSTDFVVNGTLAIMQQSGLTMLNSSNLTVNGNKFSITDGSNFTINGSGILSASTEIEIQNSSILTMNGDGSIQAKGAQMKVIQGSQIVIDPSDPGLDYKPDHYVFIAADTMIIDATSKIIGDGLGYVGGWAPTAPAPDGDGPGRGFGGGGIRVSGDGAGHGGYGMQGNYYQLIIKGKGGSSYDNKFNPLYMGSGGGAGNGNSNCCRRGGNGGGAVYIDVSKMFSLDGIVSMNGTDGARARASASAGGGGSGGSIYIKAQDLISPNNSGRLTANGGAGGAAYSWPESPGGYGAGGIIAVYAKKSIQGLNISHSGFSASFEIFPGGLNSSACVPELGSLYIENAAEGFIFGPGDGTFFSQKLYNNLTISCLGKTVYKQRLIVGNNVDITGGALLVPDSSSNNDGMSIVDIGGSLSLDSISAIESNGTGYAAGIGPGEGSSTLTGGGGGASFAGVGGNGVGPAAGNAGQIYGNSLNIDPLVLLPGSRGGKGSGAARGGKGGGALFLKADIMNINGIISVNGLMGSSNISRTASGGGGSGGSLYIDAGDFTGTNMIKAIGGRSFPTLDRGGSGGGGRIALRARRTLNNNFSENKFDCGNGECFIIPVVNAFSINPQASRNSIVTLQFSGGGIMPGTRLIFSDAPVGGNDLSSDILYINISLSNKSSMLADIYIRPTLVTNTVYVRLMTPRGGVSQEVHNFLVLSGASGLPPVTNLTAQTISSSQVNLSFIPSVNTGVLGYYVRYSTSPLTSVNWPSATPVINNLTRQSTGISVTGLLPSTDYYFGVAAYDANTPATDSVIASTGSAATTLIDTPPGQIIDLSAQTISSNFVEFSWTAPGEDSSNPPGTRASSYDLRQEMGTTLTWATATLLSTPVPQIQGTGELFTLNSLLDSTDYCFAITSQDQNANIAPVSNTLCITTAPPGDITPPADITDLVVLDSTWNAATNGAEVTITWTAPGDDGMSGTASSYELYVSKKVIRESGKGDPLNDPTREVDIDTIAVIPLTSGGSTYPCGQKTLALPQPDVPWVTQCYTLALYDADNNGTVDPAEILDSNTAYYLVLHAIDDGGNYSRSNLLKVRTALIQTARTDAWQDIYTTPPSEVQTAVGGTFTVTNTWQWNMISAAKRPMGSFFGFPIPVTVGNLFYPAIINGSQLSVWKWNSAVSGVIFPSTETFTGNWFSPLQTNAQIGDGYYVLAPQAYHTINENAVPGIEETNPSVTISLIKGWNIIGNPYRYLYSTSGQPITDRSGNSYEGSVQLDGQIAPSLGVTVIASGIEYDFDTAASMQNAGGVEIIGNTIYTWNGYGWEAKGYDNSFNDGARLYPWKGYWILANDDNLQLKIYKPVR